MKKFQVGNSRAAGILLPVFSLPGHYGIGTFGRQAYEWIDFLERAGQSYWQVLPLGPTSYGDSPYQSFSAFAGNPYFVDLDILCKESLLDQKECEAVFWGNDERKVDYKAIFDSRDKMLHKAYSRFPDKIALERFRGENAGWLEDFALFMAIRERAGSTAWTEWDEDIRMREPNVMARLREELCGDIEYHVFVQYQFDRQWSALKKYAGCKGIGIIGDIPIYVAMDSADTWSNRDIFFLDADGRAIDVAGCPPDYFSETGQLWGNPLYRWDELKKRGYSWWMDRLRASFSLYDIVRIDHFRGLESYYAIPGESDTAIIGEWRKGPGMDLLGKINSEFGQGKIIAEDLGILTDEVRELLRKSGYPGMKVLQFAFSPGAQSNYLPHNHPRHCVVYTGTHDNETMQGWLSALGAEDVEFAKEYLGIVDAREGRLAVVRAALASVGDLTIIPFADYLGLGSEARINIPATLGGNNWRWRMGKTDANPELASKILRLTGIYGRESDRKSENLGG